MSKPKRRSMLAPQSLPKRVGVKHNDWQAASEQFTLDSVCVKLSTGAKSHTYSAPSGDNPVARRLRRYVLTLSRYELPDASKYAKRWAVATECVEAASRIVSNYIYSDAYNDDPSVMTTHIDGLATMLASAKPHSAVVYKAFSLIGTDAWDLLLNKLEGTPIHHVLADTENDVDVRLDAYNGYRDIRKFINHDYKRYRNYYAIREYRDLCYILSRQADAATHAQERDESTEPSKTKRGDEHGQGRRPDITEVGEGWMDFILAKPELNISHTGRLGRRIIACDTGRTIRDINRMITDPDKRIFSRKTRALGGVVVVDASGSMNWDDRDLERVMSACAGATVLMYSDGFGEGQPNAWIVARQGRRVRHLPEAPGGNGVDGPALLYASQHLRTRRSLPIIWVSDGGVTGRGDVSSAQLHREIERICKRHNIVRVETAGQAVSMLKRLQGGM